MKLTGRPWKLVVGDYFALGKASKAKYTILDQWQIKHALYQFISEIVTVHVAGSETTTVAAPTEDAKVLVQRSLDSALEKADPKANPAPKDSAPLLSRSVKSERILEQPNADAVQPNAGAVATAVKAKAAPKKEHVEQSTPSPSHDEQSKAVQDSLHRSSTDDIANASGVKKTPEPPQKPNRPDRLASDSSSEDSEEMRKKEAQLVKKREIHARYMRFSRSLTSYLAKQIESIDLLELYNILFR